MDLHSNFSHNIKGIKINPKYSGSISRINWDAKKENLKSRFPVLTDDDLHYDNNGREGMLQRLKAKLGMSSDELHMTILTL
jgi:hypothetical protein